MGMDIHLNIVNTKGEYVDKDIFDGRNYEWFANLRHGESLVYENFPSHYGLPELVPDEIKEDEKDVSNGYFDFRYLTIREFTEWFKKMMPHIDAGWVTTYDAWLYNTKGIVPELKYRLDEDDIIHDMQFITVENEYDCSKWLYDYINKNKFNYDYYIVFYFDC